MKNNTTNTPQMEEQLLNPMGGMLALIGNLLLMLLSVFAIILGIAAGNVFISIIGFLYLCLIGPILFCGLKVLKPKEAYVLTLFGNYYGTLIGPGFFFVNPFVTAVSPSNHAATSANTLAESTAAMVKSGEQNSAALAAAMKRTKKISLKTMTLNNDKQKINDLLGNPIEIGIVVIWKVVNTAQAVFNVDNYTEFLSIQCDSALRNIVRLYPYDSTGNEESLRGSSQEIADKLKEEIQFKVESAGLEIMEARITSLAYAPEIAAAMLQRQQASAVIDARQMIVEGAVGMVEMALSRLNEKEIVHLDEERKAAMVSNLLVVLCGNKDAQPIVNSGSLY